jgi:hypothetical protein
MKRLLSSSLALLLLLMFISPAQAAIRAGSTCSIKGQIKSVSGYKYTCVKTGKKLLWSKGMKIASKPLPVPKDPGQKTIPPGNDVPRIIEAYENNLKFKGYIGGESIPLGLYYTSESCTILEKITNSEDGQVWNATNYLMILEVTKGMELYNSCTLHPGVPSLEELPRLGMNIVGTTLPAGNYVLTYYPNCRYYIGDVTEMIAQKYKLITSQDHKVITLKNGQAFFMEGCVSSYKTFDQTPDMPIIYRFRPIYLTDSEVTTDRTAAIRHDLLAIEKWFSDQLNGRAPRFSDLTKITIIRDTKINRSDYTENRAIVDTWRKTGVIGQFDVPIVYAESTGGPGCAWESNFEYGHIWFPMDHCSIYPSDSLEYPYGATYVISHEITHALGVSGHFSNSNRDVLYIGEQQRDWLNIVLDPGRVNYFRTGDLTKPDIEKSPLLTQLP